MAQYIDDYVKLLLHFDGQDQSAIHSATFAGNAQIDTAKFKFGISSLLLDGNGDYISFPDAEDFNFGTGDFTIEGWFWFNNFTSTPFLFAQYASGTDRLFALVSAGAVSFRVDIGGVLKALYSGGTVPTGQWTHIAIVRNGTSLKLFIDGVDQSWTASTAISTNSVGDISAAFEIGASLNGGTTQSIDGWVDEFRISKGIARWTGNFTPNIAPYRADTNTVLLLHFEGTDASTTTTDYSAGADYTLQHPSTYRGNAQLDTAQSKFGGSSGLFDGTGDGISLPDSNDWNLGSGDWTFDFWVRFNSLPASTFTFWNQSISVNEVFFIFKDATGRPGVYLTNSVGIPVFDMRWTPTLSTGTWYHFEFVRNGSTVLFFLDGVAQSVFVGFLDIGTTTIPDMPGDVTIGIYNDLSFAPFDGWLEEFRVSKGTARHTSNFTPETTAYKYRNRPTKSIVS